MVLGNILRNKDTLNLHINSEMKSLCFGIGIDTEARSLFPANNVNIR